MVVAGVGAQLVQFAAVVLELKLPYQCFTGAGFVETSTVKNSALGIPVMVPKAGFYTLDFRYANGSVNTEKSALSACCATEGGLLGTAVLPRRGTSERSD